MHVINFDKKFHKCERTNVSIDDLFFLVESIDDLLNCFVFTLRDVYILLSLYGPRPFRYDFGA